jgi:predicted peroxiredoxin
LLGEIPSAEFDEGGRDVKTLYFATAGAADATRASIPLHIAVNGSVEVGHETAVVLVGDAAELLSEETANQLEGVGIPPVRELLAKLLEHAVPVYV